VAPLARVGWKLLASATVIGPTCRLARGTPAPWFAAAASASARARTCPGVGTCGPAAASVAGPWAIAGLVLIWP